MSSGTEHDDRHRDGLNPPPFTPHSDHSLQYSNYDGTIDPQFSIKRESSPHLNDPNQFSDYPLYSGPEDLKPQGLFDYSQASAPGIGSINPASLTLMGEPRPHDGNTENGAPTLQINPNLQQHQAGLYSASSTQPSAGTYEWDSVFSQQPTWGHRRAPSEYSDISSAGNSPYLQNQEFGGEQPSPLLESQHIPQGSMQDLLNSSIDNFTLSDRDDCSPRVSPSPGYHSASTSPYLLPQNNQMLGMVPPIHSMMPPPSLKNRLPSGGLGISEDHVPQISVMFSPPQRQPTFPGKPGLMPDDTALSPPPKSPLRRQRSKSDPYQAGSVTLINNRSGSGRNSPVNRSRSNSTNRQSEVVTKPVGSIPLPTHRSAVHTPVNDPNAGSSKMSRRSTTTSLPNRDYILELAHPNRPGGGSGDNKRVQKHPATFQCHLCPKRFTRAYNLRSHLRTHTDERPFVCTICGKAFARQHDRKRHEGLHSGEKKFVCRGNLKPGGAWGCGRRFARADALGRHFRSEAGRVCIRPLLEEETAERAQAQLPHMMDPGMNMNMDGTMVNGMAFPTALLEQYPALARFDWSVLNDTGGDDGGYEDVVSGRSDFDASGGEYEEGNVSGGSAIGSHRNSFDGVGWASDHGDGGVGYS